MMRVSFVSIFACSAAAEANSLLQLDSPKDKCTTERIIDVSTVTKFKHDKDRLLMCPAPKTASSTLRRLLALPSVNVVDVRPGKVTSSDTCQTVPLGKGQDFGTQDRCDKIVNVNRIKTHVPQLASMFLKQTTDDTTFVIAPVRHALARVTSNFFQFFSPGEHATNNDGATSSDLKSSSKGHTVGVDSMHSQDVDTFFNKFTDEMNEWSNYQTYGRRYVDVSTKQLGIDLAKFAGEANFKDDGGLFLKTTCPSNNKTLITIVLRVEDLEKDEGSWQKTLSKFFDNDDLDLSDASANSEAGANSGDTKSYADTYHEFKRLLSQKASKKWCKRISDLDDMGMFYTQAEEEELISAKCAE